MKYEFVIWPMLVVYPVLLLLGVVIPWAGYHLERERSEADSECPLYIKN